MNKSDVWLGVLNILRVNRAVLSFSFISTFYSFLINFYSLLNVLFWLLCVLFSLSKPEIIERGLIDWLIDLRRSLDSLIALYAATSSSSSSSLISSSQIRRLDSCQVYIFRRYDPAVFWRFDSRFRFDFIRSVCSHFECPGWFELVLLTILLGGCSTYRDRSFVESVEASFRNFDRLWFESTLFLKLFSSYYHSFDLAKLWKLFISFELRLIYDYSSIIWFDAFCYLIRLPLTSFREWDFYFFLIRFLLF